MVKKIFTCEAGMLWSMQRNIEPARFDKMVQWDVFTHQAQKLYG
jgi:hypothetical protein